MIDFIDTRKGYVLIMLHLVAALKLLLSLRQLHILESVVSSCWIFCIITTRVHVQGIMRSTWSAMRWSIVWPVAFSWELGKYSAILFDFWIMGPQELKLDLPVSARLADSSNFPDHHSNPTDSTV